MLKSCPDPVDVQDILFKLRCRLKVFHNEDLDSFSNSPSLISCASRYGLLFVGTNSKTLQAIQLNCTESYSTKDKDINNYPRRNLILPSPPTHICVNCDSTILAVVVQKDVCLVVIFHDVLSFYKQTVSVIKELRLSSTPGVTVLEVNWNPALPSIFTACKSDGTFGVYELKGNAIDINELPTAAETTCFCWSPKGKQIAVGSKNGKITQYKPDLKAVKVINEPPLGSPHSLISLQWVSNYQFIGVYHSSEPEGQSKLIVVDAPKTGETSYTNYDDVCYSGNSRIPQFYMIMQQHWNLLMVASSNSTEIGVLGSVADTWTQWIISDSARAELPLDAKKQDTLPVGFALDISPSKPVPWGEGTIPPCPYLLILSHQGIYTLVVQPEKTLSSGTSQMTVSKTPIFGTPQQAVSFEAKNVNSQSLIKSSLQPQTSLFGSSVSKPTASEHQLTFSNPGDSLFAPKTETQALFSGQPSFSLTKTSQASSFTIGDTVIIPVSKVQTPEITNSKYSSILAALNNPTSTPSTLNKPVIISELPRHVSTSIPTSTQVSPLTSTPQAPRDEVKVIAKPAKQISDPKETVDEKVKQETDAIIAKMVKDECLALEFELKALLHQGRKVNINIGSDHEKIEMLKQMKLLEEFIKEIVDISCGEYAEVHNLKQNLILSWAWYEEALSRYNISKDETMTLLLKSQPLNSASEKRQSDMRKLIYYLESQLSQVNKALDEQWEKFQDYAKKTHRVQMPTMEAIFQSMVSQNAVLQKQIYILKDISSHLKQKKLSSSGPSLFLTLDDGTKKIEKDLRRLQIEPDDPHRIIYEKTMKRGEQFTFTKKNKLRKFLKIHDVTHVTVVKPQLNSTLSVSPTSKNKYIYSILGAQMSPVKANVARNLEFTQSTPIREIKQEIKPTSVPPNTPAHTESQKTFTFRNTSIFPKSVASNFSQSVDQSSILPATPSAFIPAPQITKFPSFVQVSEKPDITCNISTPTFSFSPSTNGTLPKTNNVNVTESLPSFKPSSSQFNLGNSISVLPNNQKYDAEMSSAKSSFSFSISNISDPKANQKTTLTSSSTFGTITQTKNAPTSTFSFGSVDSTVVSSTESIAKSDNGSVSISNSTPSVIKSTIFGSIPSVNKLVTSSSITTVNPVPTTSSTPIFGQSSTTIISSSHFTPTETTSVLPGKSETGSVLFGSRAVSTSSLSSTAPTASSDTKVSASKSIFDNIVTPKDFTPTLGTSSTSNQGIFGSANPSVKDVTSTSTSSIFGLGITPTTTSSEAATSVFGSNTNTTPIKVLNVSTIPAVPNTSIFGSSSTLAATTSSSSFGIAITNSDTAKSSMSTPIFIIGKSTPTSTEASVQSQKLEVPPVTTVSGGVLVTTSQQGSIFGDGSIFSSGTTVNTQPSVFGTLTTASTQPSVFGSVSSASSQPSIFGTITTTSTQSSVFGTSAATTTQPSIFGSVSAASTQPSIFGSVSTASTQSSIFGSVSTASTQSSIFGSVTVANTQSSIFGSVSTASTKPSVFGTVNTAGTQPSVFGSISTTNTSPSIFGSVNTSSSQPSVFGSVTTPSTQSSIFGSVSTPVSQSSVFGPASASQPSVFASVTTGSQIFGNTASTQSSLSSPFAQSGSIFATPKTTSSTFGNNFGKTSIFGSTPAITTAGEFGQIPFSSTPAPAFGTPTTSNSVFGSAGTNFGSVSSSSNIFGSVSSSSNLFGSAPSSSTFSFAQTSSNATAGSGSFGFGNLSVGNTATTSSSIFGGGNSFAQRETVAANPFGSQTSIFGNAPSTSSSIFGTNSNNTQTGFGTSTFGSSSSFGQQPTFGQNTFGGSFGSSQAGPFSTGGTGVGQSGFGTPASFQKPSGFSGAPAFGGSPQPAFGASPSFGGAPAFGAAPSFGSPTKVFGSNTPTAAFGSVATGSPGFGNIASQNTVGFGNLAQAATSTASFAGNSSFSSWR
nr:nuclear pore complex protein Nup214 [Leptinotarsa decemlineata]